MAHLMESLGCVDAIRFLAQIRESRGDYLELQERIFDEASVDELYERAEAQWKKQKRLRKQSKSGNTLTLEQLLAALEQSQGALAARLQNITAEELAREEQSFLGTTTLGQLIFFLYWHESYHTGQTEYLRQLAGKDDKVI